MTEILNRLSSPISGSFVIAFLLHNWELSFKVFSSAIPLDKCIEFVKEDASWLHFFFIPLIFTAIYLGCMPYLLIRLNQVKDYFARIDKEREVKQIVKLKNLENFHGALSEDNFFAMANLIASYKKSETEIKRNLQQHCLNHRGTGCSGIVDQISRELDQAFAPSARENDNLEKILGLTTHEYFIANGVSYFKVLKKLKEIMK